MAKKMAMDKKEIMDREVSLFHRIFKMQSGRVVWYTTTGGFEISSDAIDMIRNGGWYDSETGWDDSKEGVDAIKNGGWYE